MKSESSMILEIWETFKEYIPEKTRSDAATSLLRVLDDYDFGDNFAEIKGEDKWLDDALVDYLDDDGQDYDSGDE